MKDKRKRKVRVIRLGKGKRKVILVEMEEERRIKERRMILLNFWRVSKGLLRRIWSKG
jgi:hypothetical protein